MSDSGRILDPAEVDFLLSAGANEPQAPKPAEATGDAQAVTMRGDLEQINLSDIFQTLAMTKMEGVLLVRNPLEQRQVYCNGGFVRILVPPRVATRRLGQRLVQAGLLQPEHLRAALVTQRKDPKPLGELLVSEGLVTTEQIDDVVNMQVGEDLFALFTWRHGSFEFYKGPIPDPALRGQFDTCPEFEVSSLLLEVARRSDEWERILEAIGSLDEVPQRIAEPAPDAEMDEIHRTLLYGADGQATYRDLVEQTTLSLFEVARAARELAAQGFLGNVTDEELVAVADARVDASMQKQALMMLQTLRDRPGERPLAVVHRMSNVLVKAGERKLASTVLLEAAQLQSDADEALKLARQARDLAPNDAGTVSFLRTTLLAHSAPDSAELEQCTLDLIDALLDADLTSTALEIVADARATGTVRPQILVREVRARQKARDPQGAISALFDLAAIYTAEGNRQQTIDTYEAILRIDRSRKDVRKLLVQIRQTRIGRIVRAVAAAICATLVSAMGFVFWQQNRFDTAVQCAAAEITQLLAAGNRAEARVRLDHWTEELGECEQADDLRSRVAFADAAEQTRLQKVARRQANEKLTSAAETLGTGDLRRALAIYEEVWQLPTFRKEVAEVVDTRIAALLTDIEQTAKTLATRLPVEPSLLFDRRQLTENLADLQSMCRPALMRAVGELHQMNATASLPAWLPESRRAQVSDVLRSVRETFGRAAELVDAYTNALQRNEHQRRLDPTFKAAVKLEEAHDFAGALALYRQLEREPAGDAELRAHFRDHVARNATIVRLMEALHAATAAGDFATAQQQYRALKLAFPDVPFERLVRLPLLVESRPVGAMVECNGKEIGRTPCAISYCPADENRLAVSLDGFRADRATITGDQTGLWRAILLREPDLERKHDSMVEVPPVGDGASRLFLVDRGGCVTALDAKDAREVWTYRSGDLSGLLSQPLLHGDHVMVASLDGDLRALSRETGKLAWSLPNLATEVAPALTDRFLLVATTDGRLCAVDLEQRTTTAVELPQAATGKVMARGQGVLCLGERGKLMAYTLPTLAPAWTTDLDRLGETNATLANDCVVLLDDHGQVASVDLASGKVRWRRSFDVETFGQPIVDRNTVLAASPSRVLRLDLATGVDRPGIPMDEEPWARSPLRAGDRLLLPTRSGSVFVLDLATANTLYRIEGSKRGGTLLELGERVFVVLPDRRIHFYERLP